MNKTKKSLKMSRDVGTVDQQKPGNQCIGKLFSIQPTLYLFTVKIFRVGLYTEEFYGIISIPCFVDLLSLDLTLFTSFSLV